MRAARYTTGRALLPQALFSGGYLSPPAGATGEWTNLCLLFRPEHERRLYDLIQPMLGQEGGAHLKIAPPSGHCRCQGRHSSQRQHSSILPPVDSAFTGVVGLPGPDTAEFFHWVFSFSLRPFLIRKEEINRPREKKCWSLLMFSGFLELQHLGLRWAPRGGTGEEDELLYNDRIR